MSQQADLLGWVGRLSGVITKKEKRKQNRRRKERIHVEQPSSSDAALES